jgi:group I intron endonuclease
MGYIYKITNTVNNKCYIGVTIQANPNERWSHHKSAIRANIGCPFLQKAFKKYGEDAFKFEVLIICFDEDVFKFENEYILKYNSMSPNGYNVAVGGKIGMSFLGKKHTEETKKIISEKSKAHNARPEVRERARQNAIKFNRSTNRAELLRKSEKWQKALKEGRIGGHTQTDDCKKKISESLKAYYKIQNDQEMSKDTKKHSKIMTLAIGRKVSQYSKDDKQLDSFCSIKEASIKSGVNRGNISHALSGRNKTAGGFIWKYDTEPKDNIIVKEQNQTGSQ